VKLCTSAGLQQKTKISMEEGVSELELLMQAKMQSKMLRKQQKQLKNLRRTEKKIRFVFGPVSVYSFV
jgi:hypothetical protein